MISRSIISSYAHRHLHSSPGGTQCPLPGAGHWDGRRGAAIPACSIHWEERGVSSADQKERGVRSANQKLLRGASAANQSAADEHSWNIYTERTVRSRIESLDLYMWDAVIWGDRLDSFSRILYSSIILPPPGCHSHPQETCLSLPDHLHPSSSRTSSQTWTAKAKRDTWKSSLKTRSPQKTSPPRQSPQMVVGPKPITLWRLI